MKLLGVLKQDKVLVVIFLASCFFILYGLTFHDAVSDEAVNAFRAIGYYDHLVSQLQTTPYQWFEQVPWWAKLSFHDAPYLSFLIQFIFFKFFGVSLLTMRLPFALAGIGLIIILYFIFQKFIDKKLAWLPAVLLLANVYYLWSSKLGYLEILTSFFVWLSIYFFFKIKENWKNIYLWALFLGLALVTKYTAFFILPVYFLYLLFFERRFYKNKRFFLALLIILLIFSPVIIYNLMMFKTTGHFDLQFSALFGQKVEAWSRISRNTPADFNGFLFGVINILKILSSAWGPFNFVLFILSSLFLAIRSVVKKEKITAFFVIMVIVFLLLFSFIGGSAIRFLSFFNPLWAVVLALTIVNLKLKKLIFYPLVLVVIIYNLFTSFNTLILAGNLSQNKLLFSSPLVLGDYGYNQLEKEINLIIAREKPVIGKEKDNTLFIFDSNINYFAKIWYIQRRVSYELIPFASTNEVLEVLKSQGSDYYYRQGFNRFYLIKTTNNTLLVPKDARSETARILANNLQEAGTGVYKKIENRKGELMFLIYKF